MTKELFKRYSEIKNQIKALETEADEINEKVTTEMEADQVDKVESDFGSFYFTVRKTWKYSPKVDEMTEELKAQKKAEETDGTAVPTESKSLTFKSKAA
jgi:hypothetical protein